MELKTLPPPNNHQENENSFRNRGEARSNTPIPQEPVQAPQPNTNPNIRKATKITEKRKRVAPTQRFKAKIAAEPNSNKVTM